MIPVLLGVSLIIFIMLAITPGDPARMLLGSDASEEAVLQKRAELGLDDPFITRYAKFVASAVKGDLGTSYTTRQPVIIEIFERYPTTFTLAMLATIVSGILGILLGIISATRQYSIVDNIASTMALLGLSIPNFWMGLMLILLFSLKLGWFPSSGFYGPIYWVLPAITIGFAMSATITRQTRSCMLEVVRQDYIRTARAKGQSETTIIFKHALKNALIPIVTVLGIQFGGVLGGAVITEQVFSIPGLGKLMVDAIKNRNYPLVQGGVLVLAISFSLINLLVDIMYAYIDPRIKSQYSKPSIKKTKAEKTEVAAND